MKNNFQINHYRYSQEKADNKIIKSKSVYSQIKIFKLTKLSLKNQVKSYKLKIILKIR